MRCDDIHILILVFLRANACRAERSERHSTRTQTSVERLERIAYERIAYKRIAFERIACEGIAFERIAFKRIAWVMRQQLKHQRRMRVEAKQTLSNLITRRQLNKSALNAIVCCVQMRQWLEHIYITLSSEFCTHPHSPKSQQS